MTGGSTLGHIGRTATQPRRFRTSELLPLVRAALDRGAGPPAVVAWVRANGWPAAHDSGWSRADEARALARRLAARLNDSGRPDPGDE